MKLRVPAFYRDFVCIAGACPDSCCQGWEVDADPASMAYYHTLPESEIRRRIFSVLDQDEYGNTVFRLSDQKHCPFLNSENLCDMHIAIGGEHTPFTCRTFPRFINDFGALREMGLSFSCPVAAEMMFDPKYDFSFTEEMNDLPPTLNDIDARLYPVPGGITGFCRGAARPNRCVAHSDREDGLPLCVPKSGADQSSVAGEGGSR